MKRRRFLQTTSIAAGCMWASFPKKLHAQSVGSDQLRRIDEAPVLRPDYLREPIIIESVELLRNKSNFLVRIRSKDGAESVTAPNSLRLKDCYPIFNSRVGRFFVGKNACKIESLLNSLFIRVETREQQATPVIVDRL